MKMALKPLFFTQNHKNCPAGWYSAWGQRLSFINWFSTEPKLDNFFGKRKTTCGSPVLAKSWMLVWSYSLLQMDFSSDYMGCRRNELKNANAPYRFLFFLAEYRTLKIANNLYLYNISFYVKMFSLFLCPLTSFALAMTLVKICQESENF